jgi:hypothetical protein
VSWFNNSITSKEDIMFHKIALIGAATLLSVSLAAAQSSGPSSTAGGAQGTSKSGDLERPAGKGAAKNKAPKGTTGAGPASMESSPSSTAGGAAGTTKGKGNVPGSK